MAPSRTSQSGNILFLILLAVVLFAALSYAVTQSLRGGGKDVSAEKAQTIASQIINYATLMENTIQRMQLSNNCRVDQLNFANNVVSGYTNATSPGNGSCDIFGPNGGGLAWQVFPANALVTQAEANATPAAGADYGQYSFSNAIKIPSVGTDCGIGPECKELVIGAHYLSLNVCNAINAQLGQSTVTLPPNFPAGAPGANKYIGTFYSTGGFTGGNNSTGQGTGCVAGTTHSGNVFWHVLQAR